MIRIKVRTLLGMLATVALLGWFGYSQLPSFLYFNGYPEALLKWFPNNEFARPALNELAYDYYKDTGLDGDNYLFVTSAGWASGGGVQASSTPKQRADVIAELERLLAKYGFSEQGSDVAFNLAKLHMWNKEWETAESLFRQVAEKGTGARIGGEEHKAYLAMLESRHEQPAKDPAVEGAVTIDGQPAADAFVFLHRTNDTGFHSPPFLAYPMTITDKDGHYRFYDVDPDEYEVGVGLLPEQLDGYYLAETHPKSVTIHDGNAGESARLDFRFVPQVVTVSPSFGEVIEDIELRMQWEPYEGAAYYELSLTSLLRDADGKYVGSTSKPLTSEKFVGASATFAIDELKIQYGGLRKSIDADGRVALSASSLLGIVHPGGEFIWSVDAYDANGRKLSSSAGYFLEGTSKAPLFRISEEGMLEGDRLVMESRYEDAIASYEREGDNDRALRALARLAHIGITESDGDPREALRYLERVKEPNEADIALIEQLKEKIKEAEASTGSD